MNAPKTYKELQQLPRGELMRLWEKLFREPPKSADVHLYRPLWHRIQCRRVGKSLDQKYITKLNKYAKDPDAHIERARALKYELKPGSIITKIYKGQAFTLRVIADDRFEYNGETYASLSAAAQAMIGMKVSGTDFFGLNNKTCAALDMT
jgi:hypothetical protein